MHTLNVNIYIIRRCLRTHLWLFVDSEHKNNQFKHGAQIESGRLCGTKFMPSFFGHTMESTTRCDGIYSKTNCQGRATHCAVRTFNRLFIRRAVWRCLLVYDVDRVDWIALRRRFKSEKKKQKNLKMFPFCWISFPIVYLLLMWANIIRNTNGSINHRNHFFPSISSG